MPSSKEYRDFILGQLSGTEDISCRAMMGEYLLYHAGKVVGGIYDDRLLIKPSAVALAMLPQAPRELPYPGGKEMLLVEDVDDSAFLQRLFGAL